MGKTRVVIFVHSLVYPVRLVGMTNLSSCWIGMSFIHHFDHKEPFVGLPYFELQCLDATACCMDFGSPYLMTLKK